MKKCSIYILLISSLFFSCKKNDVTPTWGESPVIRINDTLSKYQKILSSAPYGWKGLVQPSGLSYGVFGFYFKFNDSNRVQMFSDFDSASSINMLESSYRLAAYNQPTLVFDTYSYIHLLADPDGSVNGGTNGAGLSSDFEFSIDSLIGDTLKLTGRAHHSKAILVRATQAEQAAWYNKTNGARDFKNYGNMLTYFKRFNYNGIAYDVAANFLTHTIGFTWIDAGGTKQNITTGFYFASNGISFYPAFNDGTHTIGGFDNIVWDNASRSFSFTVNNNAAKLTEIVTPVWVDKDAPAIWWQTGIWISAYGFHKNGVDDAFGLENIPDYSFFVYYPKPNGGNYDAVVAFYNNANSLFGNAVTFPTFTLDGRAVFKNLGTLQAPSPSDSSTVIMTNTINQLVIARGYYFVQTSNLTYDMVSADDGKAWLTWQAN